MICEHWTCDDSDTITTPKGIRKLRSQKLLGKNPKRCCTIRGKDWTEVMTKYHKHMGWEPYVPMK